ncbi:hypothetical protein KQX54_005352 [Cotesia glomerata]|uniref:Uncharacterized protein n=1 Tax=Cotesia glomerata TaxID=32391 RepID=A0AAV7IQ80_COTGL|nr:hypothetical protein KQX54_005352 [Cotesia glomerata]
MSTNDKEAVNVEKKTENDKPTEDAKCELKGIKRAAEKSSSIVFYAIDSRKRAERLPNQHEKNEDTKKPKRQENGDDNEVDTEDNEENEDEDEDEDEADEDDVPDDDGDDDDDDDAEDDDENLEDVANDGDA